MITERGLTQKAIAQLADVPVSTVCGWVSGVLPTDPLAAYRLAKALNVDFQWLLTSESSKGRPSEIPISEIFDLQDEPAMTGMFGITARRLKKKKV